MSVAAATLAIVGTLSGLVCAVLGLSAVKYLSEATETDRVAGWTMLWFFDRKRYSKRGQALCTLGALAGAIGTVSWIACAVVQ